MARKPNKSEDKLLPKLVDYYERYITDTSKSRDHAKQGRDYYDGNQWTSEELRELEKRGQPAITDNRVKDKVDSLLGMELESRSDPKAFPRTPEDQNTAEAATDALRYVAENNDFHAIRSDVTKSMFIEGTGAAEIVIKAGKAEPEVSLKKIMWARFWYDPDSREKDFSDVEYIGQRLWMTEADAERKWPASKKAISDTMFEGEDAMCEHYGDMMISNWVDPKRKRIRILECYYRDKGEWYRVVFTRAGILEGPEVSAYFGEEGRPEHPYVARSPYIDRRGTRYGEVKRLVDIQDEHNKRRSKALHLLNTNQIIMEDGAVKNVSHAREQISRPDGVVVKNKGYEFEVERNLELAQGHVSLLQITDGALATASPNASLEGAPQAVRSGRALQLEQQSSIVELGPLFENVRQFEKACYRKVWSRIKQFWTDEKWIRVRDDDKNMKFVALNRPIASIEDSEETGLPIGAVQNPVGELDVDIMIETAPDTLNIQQEQFAELVSLANSGAPIPPKLLIEASNLRNKERLIDILEGKDEEGEQLPPPPDPAMLKLQMDEQRFAFEQQKAATDAQMKQEELAVKTEAERIKIEGQQQLKLLELQAEQELKQMELQAEAALEQQKMDQERDLEIQKLMMMQQEQQVEPQADTQESQAVASAMQDMANAANSMAQAVSELSAPKKIIRDEKGRPVGVEPVRTIN